MFKIKAISAIAAAAIVAGAITFFPGMSVDVEASTPASSAKSDRIAAPAPSVPCTGQAWPYYDHACLRDASRANGRAKPVRTVTADRLPGQAPMAAQARTSR